MELPMTHPADSRLAVGIRAAVLMTMLVVIADIANPSLLLGRTGSDAVASAPAAVAPGATSEYFPARFGPPVDPSDGADSNPPTF